VAHPDQYIRNVASEALGRLSRVSGNIFTSREVKWLLDQIAETREPHVRAGCALALGCIHSQLGGMAAGYHLKSIQQYLMSLASDPHPTVHFWALESLSRVADSAGLNFSGYVMETLGLLAQLYIADTHNEEAPLPGASNLEVELATPVAIARCVDSTINVLGPDLQDMTKAREMIMTLVLLFQHEESIHMLVQTLRCQENIALYAPGYIYYAEYVKSLQAILKSDSLLYRDIALNGLYNLMRADATAVFKTADPGLDEQLWNVLNQTPNQRVVRNIIRNWLEQTALTETALWIQRCQTVLTKIVKQETKQPVVVTAKTGGVPDLQDEEVAGFAAAAGISQEDNRPGSSTQELLKWQVRTFTMECLGELLSIVTKEAITNEDSPSINALQQKIADVVRVAFSASTSGVVQLRIEGLKIVDRILKVSYLVQEGCNTPNKF
jgi:HEAT repeat-containing protein 5